jgi:hypothetical protein
VSTLEKTHNSVLDDGPHLTTISAQPHLPKIILQKQKKTLSGVFLNRF